MISAVIPFGQIVHQVDVMKAVTGKSSVTARYEAPRAGDVRDSLADLTRARELLNYEPRVNLKEGLKLTFDWWQKNS